ncbi:MAG: DUF58 domain-containing protein [Burkholderiaceae bacterium]|nr:DUF58 domain-containing protein [Burkholderiaceae bacterium]
MSAASQGLDARAAAPDAAPVPGAAASGPLYQRLIELIPGRSRPRAGDYRLTRRNVFMLPTRAGLLFAGVVLTMLVTALNYQLSLGYALTFLVASIAIVGMLHTFRNLAMLTLRPGRAEPVFAGQIAEFTLIARNETKLERFALSLNAAGMAQPEYFDVAAGAEHFVTIALPARRRGWMPLPKLTLTTTYPIGIWRAWARWHPALRVLVHPQPETPAAPLPACVAASGEGSARGQGHEDIAALRPYAAGDSPRLIAWKAIARTASDGLITKQFDGGHLGELTLEWSMLPTSMDTEARLSRLTRWVLDADAAGVRYALALPGVRIPTDTGAPHRARCLEALATFGERSR